MIDLCEKKQSNQNKFTFQIMRTSSSNIRKCQTCAIRVFVIRKTNRINVMRRDMFFKLFDCV